MACAFESRVTPCSEGRVGQVWPRISSAGGQLLIPKVIEAILGLTLLFSDSVAVYKAHQKESISVGSALGAKLGPRGLMGKHMTHHALGAPKGCQHGLSASLAFCALSLGTQYLPPSGEAISADGLCGCRNCGQA